MKRKKFYEEMTTLELLNSYLLSKLPRGKQKLIKEQEELNNPPKNIQINHLAVILDDNVEEVIRCENRLAALLLSNPIFIEFDPEKFYPTVGLTKYVDESFVNLENKDAILKEDEIQFLLDDLDKKNE